ncbi:MAG: hypothetical protein ACYC46_06685 [Acidobacteriaceae bacterium]
MPAKSLERATSRTVVLLRGSDRKKLDDLAAREQVSAGEIIRRSLDTYESLESRIRKEEEEKMMEAALKLMRQSLSEANRSLQRTNAKLDKLHLQLKKRDIR